MTLDKHKNIFYAYRGPKATGEASEMREARQIEDNFTKAFINLLDPGNLKEKVGGTAASRAKAILGGIVPRIKDYGMVERITLQESTYGGSEGRNTRLDACVFFSKGVLGIESKVDAEIDKDQLASHYRNICKSIEHTRHKENYALLLLARSNMIEEVNEENWFNGLPHISACSWEGISNRLKDSTVSVGKGTPEDFVLTQFIEYLELNGMVEHFVKADFDNMYEGDFAAVKGKLGDFLEHLRKKPGLGKFCVYSKAQQRNTKGQQVERTIWNSMYEPSLGKLEQVPHITFDMDERNLGISLSVQGKTAPYTLISGMEDDKEVFLEHLKTLERLSKSWRTADKPLFRVQYWVVSNYGTYGPEDGFITEVPLYELATKSGERHKKGTRTHYHEKNIPLRKRKVEQILDELATGKSPADYSYFRICLQIPKSSILRNDTLEKQLDFVYKEAKPLFERYKDWKKWFLQGGHK